MPDGFFTRNGKVHPINGSRKGRGGTVLAAGVTALAITAVSGGGAATGGLSGLSGGSALGGESASVRVSNAKQSASKGRPGQAWKRMRLRVTRQRSPEHRLDCVVHSFGQVQEFFVRNRCRSLDRVLIPLADEQGNELVVSVAWVRMPSSRKARALDRLDDRDGTGDITALGQSALTARGVVFTGEHYESRVSGGLFVRAEAARISGAPDAEVLDGAAEVAVMLPPP